VDAVSRARRVRLLVLDVDGVLTDGGLYYDSRGRITKRFHVQDGLGIKMAQAEGIEIAVISGLSSDAVHARVRELGIKEYHDGFREKIPVIEQMARENGIDFPEMAYLGDDWVDAGPMSRVGLAMAVADAQPEILAMAHWVSRRPGGQGAVREAVNFLLQAQGKLEQAFSAWLP
jgi:3-deoxy-D-manno-octulosonate 8-phosphate phosphatase (KDO 8-P phosphatase)